MAFIGDNASCCMDLVSEGDTNTDGQDSFNVSSLTDVSAGKHTVNFSITDE